MGLLGQESGLYSLRMPNKLNFGFDYYYASILGLIAYLPGKLPTSAIFHETAYQWIVDSHGPIFTNHLVSAFFQRVWSLLCFGS